ncbi:C1 family peptidase [Amycolatopsis sp., V23-08]|uniref:C1 family peptidase n=1 Tax=Amycolatopsis heterodermiae TaxID=3110235 RepID=A0ABU5QWQ2_9PSEU|nr:C1 family peptidase [Amycolatopsis sp., V23-08]MEA5358293.1 C1 family peptidase [Amycolatopsis sp., V23-08]
MTRTGPRPGRRALRNAERRAAALARPAVDLTDQIGSPLTDQGPRPTCVPVSLASTHEAERHADGPEGFQAAIEPVWWHLHTQELTGPEGVRLTDAASALTSTGHCHRDRWPYDTTLGAGTEPPPPAAGNPPWLRARLNLLQLAHDGIEDALEDKLAGGHPVVLVLEMTDSFLDPGPDGLVAVPDIRVPSGGYHAVVAVGAWTDRDRERVLLIRNSWGDWWGAGGHCLLPVGYLINFAVQAATLEVTGDA